MWKFMDGDDDSDCDKVMRIPLHDTLGHAG